MVTVSIITCKQSSSLSFVLTYLSIFIGPTGVFVCSHHTHLLGFVFPNHWQRVFQLIQMPGTPSISIWHRDSSLPSGNWVAVFRLLSEWLMLAESLSKLAQNQLFLYYRTSYSCQYRHRVRKSAYLCPLLSSTSSKSVLAPSHLEGTGQIPQLE